MNARLAVFLAAVLLSGCVSSGTKVTQTDISQFKKGVTTEAEVVAKLGKPTGTSITSSGTKIDVYSYVHAAANAASYIPIVGLAAGGATGESTVVMFTFDANGVLKEYTATQSNSDVKTGLLNQ